MVQILTQSDRQQIGIFHDGVLQNTYLVPKPIGVRDGFFRFAELHDVLVLPSDLAVLLYWADNSSGDELPLIVALDLKTQNLRWVHRAKGDRLKTTPDEKEGVYLFSSKDPIVRLPIELQRGETLNRNGIRSVAKIIELPTEVQDVGDLLPTGGWTFLLAHKAGLSTYFGIKGWIHHPAEGETPKVFQNVLPVLVKAKKYWWQPHPGRLVQVQADGTPINTWTQEQLVPSDPYEKDGGLLHLLGTDALGQLWFNLASLAAIVQPPAPPPTASPSQTDSSGQTADPTQGLATTPEDPYAGLADYAAAGLDRLYQWDPDKDTLRRMNWPDAWPLMHAPAEIPRPSPAQIIRPESRTLLIENGAKAWILPLGALPFSSPSTTSKPIAHPR